MTGRPLAIASLLLLGSASFAHAQPGRVTGNDIIIAKCGGAENVIVVPGGLSCKSTPSTSGASSVAGLGEAFMQILRGLEADAERRAAEQRARRNMALQILQQHRQAALNRQDAVRAQQLNEIEARLARSENLFKGMTGAGAGLGIKTQSSGGLQMKTGRAATASLDPRPAPAAAPPAPAAEPGSEADALLKEFNSLPIEEQAALVKELQSRLAPPAETEELRDAPADFTPISPAHLEPIQVPEGMTPEDAKRLAADLFQKETGLDVESVLSRARAEASANPGPEGAPAPSTGGQPPANPAGVDRCAHVDTSTVDFCRALDRVGDRRQQDQLPGANASSAAAPPPPVPPRVNPRPITDEELRLARVTEPFDAGVVFSKLARRHEPSPTQQQRLEVLKMIRSDAVSRYAMEPAYAKQVDALIDDAVKAIRAERAEMELQTWEVGTKLLFAAIDRVGLRDPDAATLLQNESFVRERDAIARLGAKWRREIQIVEERRLFNELYKALWKMQ